VSMPTSKEIRATIRVLEQFKDIDPDISLPSILALLYIAEDDGQRENQWHMEQKLGMSNATASRAASHWFKWKRPKVAGHDFIVSEVDPEDRRYKILYLTHKGQKFIERLKASFNGE